MTVAAAESLLERRRRFLFPNLYAFYENPPEIVRGRGKYLFDAAGRRYLDCVGGVSVLAVGHSHPQVVEAVARQMRELAHTTTLYLTRPMVDLAERLAQLGPAGLTRTFFVASGSEANEGAALAAQLHTGRRELVALDRSLHGRTKLGMSLTGLRFWHADDAPVDGVHHVPTPYCYRCPLGLKHPSCGLACTDEIDAVARSGRVAALFVEPVLGNGGIVVPPPGWMERVREILDRYDVLLVVDEVQTGFGRTGRWFGVEHWDVAPDLMSVAKALGGGLPIAAFRARDDVARSFDRPSASTWGGNLVSCAAALAVLGVLESERLVERSAEVGAHFLAGLRGLVRRHRRAGDARGLGLMLGLEIVDGRGAPDPVRADRLLEGLRETGVLAGKGGAERNVLVFQPPLTFGRDDAEAVVERLDWTLTATREGAA